jgi:tetratricopeptide (TPR) repeat protein
MNTFALTGKGDYLLKLRNYTGAIVYADKALEVDPKNINALIIKALALDHLGKHAEAIRYFDKALETDPNNRNALYGKGFVLNELGDRTISKVF